MVMIMTMMRMMLQDLEQICLIQPLADADHADHDHDADYYNHDNSDHDHDDDYDDNYDDNHNYVAGS